MILYSKSWDPYFITSLQFMVHKPYFLPFRSIWVHLQFSVRFVLLGLSFSMLCFVNRCLSFCHYFFRPLYCLFFDAPLVCSSFSSIQSLRKRKYLSNLLIMSVPDKGYSIDASCALNLISTFLLHCTITGSIPLQVEYFSQKVSSVIALTLIWLIRYISHI
jgi:hypothetical protein